jgi:MFS-type transporter involved in bile tolerance (Atg22 family)
MNELSSATIALIVVIGGVITPLLTSLFKKEKWPTQVKQGICLVVSAAVGIVAIEIDQSNLLTGLNVAAFAGMIFGLSTFVYGLLFKGSAVDLALAAFPRLKPPTP